MRKLLTKDCYTIYTIVLHLVCAGLLLTVSINSYISVPGEFLE